MEPAPPDALVGRDDAVRRVTAAVRTTQQGGRSALLVSGSAGIGKTALLRAGLRGAAGVDLAWGTSVPGGSAPGYWPWTQALNDLVRATGRDRADAAADGDRRLIAAICPALGDPGRVDASSRGRMLLHESTAAWLRALAAGRPLVVVLDDVQWMDQASLDLLELVLQDPRPAALCVLVAFRHDDAARAVHARLEALVERAEHVHLTGLDLPATGTLVERVVGRPAGDEVVAAIFRRAGGHPFFTRELAHAAALGTPADDVPAAVRGAVERRVAALSPATQQVLRAAAVVGSALLPDVLSAVTGLDAGAMTAAVADAASAGLVVRDEAGTRFAHDLVREALAAATAEQARPALHLAVAAALEERRRRGGDVPAAELARHYLAAIALGSLRDAVVWALRAAEADKATLAIDDAAGRLRRLRAGVADAGLALAPADLVDVLLAEADLVARAGRPSDARGLVRAARAAAERADDAVRVARTALATAALGSRFASRRDEVVGELESALDLLEAREPALEARLTAALARELQHSVPEQRARAGPLTEQALARGRTVDDPDVLVACLLARHDVLWTPGQGPARAEVASELVALTARSGDPERHAEALLLQANALLESGSAAFAPALDACLALLEELGQPRHLYTCETRRACRALMRGDLEEAAARISRAAELGHRIREPDTENVRMSQLLELVRARADPGELRRFADEAVAHWTGAPVHAHAVAAGFCARAGDRDGARHHVAAVADLGGWRSDRSYLRSVFVRELAVAAVALEDRALCRELLSELQALAGSCGVNGAVVAFAGSHAHTAGLLAAALHRREAAHELLAQACDVYERLGAREHLTQARAALADRPASSTGSAMRRRGALWEVTHDGRTAAVNDCKGMHDVATLVQHAGRDVHVLDLVGTPVRAAATDELVDRTALSAYRRRLGELADDRVEAERSGDVARLQALDAEHEALLGELRGGTRRDGRPRQFANHPAERARKAVAGRIRDALRRLAAVLPEAAEHLERHIDTGVRCRYRGDIEWAVER